MDHPQSSLPQYQLPFAAAPQFSGDTSAGMSRVLIVITWILLGCYIVYGLSMLGMQLTYRGLDPATHTRAMVVSPASYAYFASVTLLLFIMPAAALIFVVWGHRLIATVRQLGAAGLRRVPYDAWLYFLIPIMCFYEPYNVYADIWRASTPRVAAGSPGRWRREPVPGVVVWWWALFLVGIIAIRVHFWLLEHSRRWGALQIGLWIDILLSVLAIALCAVLIRMVNGFASRVAGRIDSLQQLAAAQHQSVAQFTYEMQQRYVMLHPAKPSRAREAVASAAQASAALSAQLAPRIDILALEKKLCLGTFALYFAATFCVAFQPERLDVTASDKPEAIFMLAVWAVITLYALFRSLWKGSYSEKLLAALLLGLLAMFTLSRATNLLSELSLGGPGYYHFKVPQSWATLYYIFGAVAGWAITLLLRDAAHQKRADEEADYDEL